MLKKIVSEEEMDKIGETRVALHTRYFYNEELIIKDMKDKGKSIVDLFE